MDKEQIRRIGVFPLKTIYGYFDHFGYVYGENEKTVICLVNNKQKSSKPPAVRIQYGCMHGSVFGAIDCDCHFQIDMSLRTIAESGNGAFIYFPEHEGMGIGLKEKIRLMEYEINNKLPPKAAAAKMNIHFSEHYPLSVLPELLKDSGLKNDISLITSNIEKIEILKKYGVNVINHQPIEAPDGVLSSMAILEKIEKKQKYTLSEKEFNKALHLTAGSAVRF